MKGKFITVEGIEGVGKTTNIEFIHQQLLAAGKDVVVTREPGGTPLGEAIRGLLLDPAYTGMDSTCELQLMFAARAQHLAQVIWPALDGGNGYCVIVLPMQPMPTRAAGVASMAVSLRVWRIWCRAISGRM